MTAAEGVATGRSVGLHRYVGLVAVLAARALKVRYRGSFLGVLWSLSNPLLMTGVYTGIFGAAFAKYYGGSIASYVLAVFVALAVLAFFSNTTSQALSSVVSNGSLLNKVALPYSAFPVGVVAANVFQLAVGTLPLLLIVALLKTHSLVNVIAVLFPLTGLVLTCAGFALALSALYVYFRDVPYLYEVLTFVLYMTTPVFYPADLVPPAVRSYLALNPVATIVESLRHIALVPSPPHISDLLIPLATGFLILATGVLIFLPLRREFIDLL